MKAAIVVESGKAPTFGDFDEPAPTSEELLVRVTAAALSNVTRSRASGAHYSSSNRFPFVVGVDGVGHLENGQRVYFVLPKAPFGAMAEQAVVPASHCIRLPDKLDDVTAAAIANPGMSSWVALSHRAHLMPGETVLVNGATGTAGALAVQIAKYRGAHKVVATGRNEEALRSMASLGADVAIPINDAGNAFEQALVEQFEQGIDVVLDYVWGPSAERIIAAAAKGGKEARSIRFVHIGSASAQQITLPGVALRSSALTLMGSGVNSVPLEGMIQATGDLLEATIPGGFRIAVQSFPLSDVEKIWNAVGNHPRAVFLIG